jgi:hypothetical protein
MLVYKILLITGAALGVAMYFFLVEREKNNKPGMLSFATIVHAAHWPNKYVFSNTMNSYHVQFNFFAKAVSDSTEIKDQP